AIVSLATVLALIPTIPRALAMRTPTELESVVRERTAELIQANAALEREVQERLRVERQIREQQKTLRMGDRAISAENQGILITDATQPDNPIVFASEGFERISGYTAADIIGRNCRFLQGRDSDPRTVAEVRASIAAAVPCTVDIVNYRKDGTS